MAPRGRALARTQTGLVDAAGSCSSFGLMRRFIEMLLVCALFAACSQQHEQFPPNPFLLGIYPSPAYSAFGGSHTYVLTPIMSSASDSPEMAATLVWGVDEKFVSMEPFDELSAAVKLTMREAGVTEVSVKGEFFGHRFGTRARLTITEASDEAWERGDARFHSGPQSSPEHLRELLEDMGFEVDCWRSESGCSESDCAVLKGAPSLLPKDAACSSCHDESTSDKGLRLTSLRLSGVSDDDLISMFSEGSFPAGHVYESEILKNRACGDSLFRNFHAWSMDEADKRGLVLKLRSLPPL